MEAQRMRVACLYRVSTRMQVEKDDIPMQKTACREFIEKQKDWILVNEYYEKGVSGYKKSLKDRDVLQQIKTDAANKKFDVLLVFMLDRLGRREDETPLVIEYLCRQGIQVWSTNEGQQKVENRTDKLMLYIKYWQSGGESENTSRRVDENHSQMTKNGMFRGGVAPYGYRLERSGVLNKKGKELQKLVIDEEESKVVQIVYNLAYEQGYGGLRIAKYLNEHGIKPRKGQLWSLAVTNYMLRNPIYKGYLAYGKTSYKVGKSGRQKPSEWVLSDKPVGELVIVSEDIWNKIQHMRKFRTPECFQQENMESRNYPMQTKSPLLLTGFVRCGHCNSTLCTAYSKKSWSKKDGTERSMMKPVYKCAGKTSGNSNCDGQYTYGQEKIEGIVMEEIYKYLDQLAKVDLTKSIEDIRRKNTSGDDKELKKLKKDFEECIRDLTVLESEIAKSILGKSEFKKDTLAKLIEEKEAERSRIKIRIEKLENSIKEKKVELEEMEMLQKKVPDWKQEFDNADIGKKKMMLSQIIDEVVVWRDKVEINVKLMINEFIKGFGESNSSKQNNINGRFS